MIDNPIIELIYGLNKMSYCFTLQCCYGHFIYAGQNDPHKLEPLSITDAITRVGYRIAYICPGIENSDLESKLLERITSYYIPEK